MTKKNQPRPWHRIVRLKEELRSGALSLAEFAADLHEVTLGQGRRPVYEEPEKFFALTYPTHALRELVRDVAGRLAGQSDKAVRQLELTYGGGKTHTLITLYHLFRDPEALPDLPAVREFREHVGAGLPRAFVATLCFDKIDVERGIEGVRAPGGGTRTLRHPWSVLAFQLAGAEGLRAIHGEGRDEERETPPAEPLLVKLLEKPQAQGLATLVLVDEVLMYAREKAGIDPVWRDRIEDFFQSLTQAVAKMDRAAMVASLLATDPRKQRGALGAELIAGLFDVFRRQREEGVQPVQKEDVAEVLRRRFFEPEDVRDPSAFRPHVIGVVRGLARLDDATAGEKSAAEERFCNSFPFHPDLTDVFYSRWTQLEGFQRTRGILRTLATALREAEKWDTSPLVGPSALLAAPAGGGEPRAVTGVSGGATVPGSTPGVSGASGGTPGVSGRSDVSAASGVPGRSGVSGVPGSASGVSEAVRELAGVASTERAEGNRVDWAPLLEAELARARQIQDELPALREGREAEQAVIATFLHSQPIGHKAYTPELVRMAGSRAPDAIELEKGLRRWRELSWFLDDEDAGAEEPAAAELPKSWRLGNRPNLRQMHDEACRQRVSAEAVEARLEKAIRKARPLTEGASAAGVSVHLLPASPRDVGDDGSFRYVVPGPGAASESGKPSALAKRFLDEAGGPQRPRVHRNAVVLAVPSHGGLEAARAAVRALLGWDDVKEQLQGHQVDQAQHYRLIRRHQDARVRVPDAVRQAYSIVVTVNERNAVHAFKLAPGAGPLFAGIKGDDRARIKETAVDAAALLPDGPYDLWREGDDARFVKGLADSFARYPRLPKVLNPRVLLDTVLQGVERGLLVARLARPDASVRTWWREAVDPESRADPQLEVVLPEKAELNRLPEDLLAPGALPELWEDGGDAGSADGAGGSGHARDAGEGDGGDGARNQDPDPAGGQDARDPGKAEGAANRSPSPTVTLRRLLDYFRGGHVARVPREGYDDTFVIPRCLEHAILDAVQRGVGRGTLWLTNGPASVWMEPIPYGVLDDSAVLHPAPDLIPPQELVEQALPGAWKDGRVNGVALVQAASQARGAALPWGLVRESIRAGVESRWLRVAEGSGPMDCGYDEAGHLRLERPAQPKPPPPGPSPSLPSGGAVLEGSRMQDLAEIVPAMMEASAGSALRFHVRVALDGETPEEVRAALDALLAGVSEDLKTT